MKTNKFNLLIVLGIIITSFYSNAQERVWEETDQYKVLEVWGDNVGNSVKVDVTCSAKTVSDAVFKARKLALYNYIFIGYDANGSASAIKKLTDKSVYEGSLDFFTDYINEEKNGLGYTEAILNTSKPGGMVPGGKKKLVRVTITVTLKIDEIRKDLENKGKLKSMASISESLGPITVVVKPNDYWLKRLGVYKEFIDNQGKKQIIKDYSQLSLHPEYTTIIQSIRTNLGDGFKVDDIGSQLANSNNEVMRNNLTGDSDLEETGEEMMARTIQADIILEVSFEKQVVSGGMETELSISLTGIDPYTNSSSEMAGDLIRKSTSGDKFNNLLDTTLKSVCNDFMSKAQKFLVSRDEKGLPGKVIFKIPKNIKLSDGTPLLFSMKLKIENEKINFSELVDEAIEELGKGKAQGEQTDLRRVYDVKIPSKVKNRKGKEVTNNYEKFSAKVEEYITENLKGVSAVIKTVGSGRVVVVFKAI